MVAKMPRESQEQIALVKWCMRHHDEYKGIEKIFAVPNGGKRNPREAARMKAEGLRPGVPDLFLPVARGGHNGLFIEMKRRKGGAIGELQGPWIEALREGGYRVEVCKGFAEARAVIIDYFDDVVRVVV